MVKKKAKKKVKDGRGGARPGAGRPTTFEIGGEIKKIKAVRVYPSQLAAIEAKYGKLQAAINTVFDAAFIESNKPR